jgi:hypothetical protein
MTLLYILMLTIHENLLIFNRGCHHNGDDFDILTAKLDLWELLNAEFGGCQVVPL